MSSRLLRLNILSYLGLLIVNVFALQLPFFGRTPGDVSDLFPNLLTPADFAFKIWSFIYILLGVFTFVQVKALFSKKKEASKEVSAIGYLFMLTCILNFIWLVLWQSLHLAWSFAFMFLLWIALIVINYRLTKLEDAKWQYVVPFSLYLAWVCVAALANLNILLIDLEFNFFNLSEEAWTASLIAVGILGTLLVIYLNQDIWFTLVLIWAFFGIYVKNSELSKDGNWVVYMTQFAIIFLGIICLFLIYQKWLPKKT